MRDIVYAIGDIHGESDQLDDRLRAVSQHAADAGISRPKLIFLGDYIDRGPDSRGVLDILTGSKMDAVQPVYLAGNHDMVLAGICEGGLPSWDWINKQGGQACMDSYGQFTVRNFAKSIKQFRAAIPQVHKAFLAALKGSLSYRHGDLFFSHAGVDPDRPLSAQKPATLLYGEMAMFEFEHPAAAARLRDMLGARIVHGHFVCRGSGIDVWRHRVGIDTGAGYPGCRLTAVAIEGEKIDVI